MDLPVITESICAGVADWEKRLATLPEEIISSGRNRQNRSIRQILGHLIDSASNNIHRIIHLQYRNAPVNFPNYATNGNNDRWIAIQDYQHEDWQLMIQLWKYTHLHLVHLIKVVDQTKLENFWISGPEDGTITLRNMISSYLPHFKLHLKEIEELLADGEQNVPEE
jgi:hypothetical protein